MESQAKASLLGLLVLRRWFCLGGCATTGAACTFIQNGMTTANGLAAHMHAKEREEPVNNKRAAGKDQAACHHQGKTQMLKIGFPSFVWVFGKGCGKFAQTVMVLCEILFHIKICNDFGRRDQEGICILHTAIINLPKPFHILLSQVS